MKATDLKPNYVNIEDIYKIIESINGRGEFKHFIPNHVRVSDETKLQLIKDGFKVYNSNYDGIIIDALIIEW